MGILGDALKFTDAEAALPILQANLATLRRFPSKPEEAIFSAIGNVATCYVRLGRHDEALRHERTAYARFSAMYGPGDKRTIACGTNLTSSLKVLGLNAEAEQFAREQLGVSRRALGETHDLTMTAAVRLAETLCRRPVLEEAHLREAEALYADVVTKRRRTIGPSHPNTINSADQLAAVRATLAKGPAFTLFRPEK